MIFIIFCYHKKWCFFLNGNLVFFFKRVKNCKSPTISVPERAIYPYYLDVGKLGTPPVDLKNKVM